MANEKLNIVSGNRKGEEITLKEEIIVVGRSPDCDIRLKSPRVSKHHCQFSKLRGTVILHDLNSQNGTYINGERIVQKTLAENDKIVIGDISFIFTSGKKEIVEEEKKKLSPLRKDELISNVEIVEIFERVITAIEKKGKYFFGHSRRVKETSLKIARKMGLGEKKIMIINLASLLHDIGNIYIDDSIFLKKGQLSNDEFEKIKQHPLTAQKILIGKGVSQEICDIIKFHHERFDGEGYASGLKGEDIPIESRIILLAEAIDAMTFPRPYRNSVSQEDMLKEIKENSGNQFDPGVVLAFSNLFREGRE